MNDTIYFEKIETDSLYKVDHEFIINQYNYLLNNRNLSESEIINLKIEFADKLISKKNSANDIQDIEIFPNIRK